MQNLFVLAELLDELFDTVLAKKELLLRRINTLVCKGDFEPRIQKRQLAQSRSQTFELKLGRDCENRRIWQESDECASSLLVFDLADDSEFVGRFPFGERHVIDLAVTRDLRFEPFRERVRAFRAYAMQAAGIFVCALSKFSASVQICEHQLDGRHLPFGMDVGRDSPAIVTHRDRSIDMN